MLTYARSVSIESEADLERLRRVGIVVARRGSPLLLTSAS
jgi:hypothetical protein